MNKMQKLLGNIMRGERAVKKKWVAVLLTFILVLSCTGCGISFDAEDDDYDYASEETEFSETVSVTSGTTLSLEKEGNIVINRNVELGDVPMGEDGTWTIFVYLCGTDLESSSGGFATYDMQEMLDASTGENVRFIVQTGGTNQWCNDVVEASELGRYEICNGNIDKLNAQKDASMGDGDTLVDFLEWGIRNYPAANMGVVLWNHGGGSIAGVCVDETWERDRLYLSEIDAALATVSGKMTDKFEFIGFDACLMATVECANILVPYANYMYASEENEAGYGWDYKAIGNYLGKNPTATGEELGRIVCDSFFEMLEQIGAVDNGTLSVTDLSKIDELLKSYHLYAKELDAAAKDLQTFSLVVRNIYNVDTFGNSSKTTGYTNMVDLAGVVSAGFECTSNASQVLEAIDEAVVYARNGILHEDSCGLSTYYPLEFKGSAELEIFGDIAISPYYLSFVTRTAYGLEHNGDMSGYVEEEVVDVWSDQWGEGNNTGAADDYWDEFANTEASGNGQLIQFEQEPAIVDGWQTKFHEVDEICYGFKLTKESEDNVVAIYVNKWKASPDGKYMIDLGNRAILDVGSQYGYGYFTKLNSRDLSIQAEQGSEWTNDGWYEPIATYAVSANPKKRFYHYMVPMLVNDEKKYVHMIHNTSGGEYFFQGIWDGIASDGMSGRELRQLEASDIITPIYQGISFETGEEVIYYGDPIQYHPDNTFVSCPTAMGYDNSIYMINFEIIDAYGNSYQTKYACYKVGDASAGELLEYKLIE